MSAISGTVGQGLLAALLDVTIDAKFSAGVPPLSEREVFEFAEPHDGAATESADESPAGGSDSTDPSGVARDATPPMPRQSDLDP